MGLDVATLGLKVDSKPVGKASDELDRFKRSGKGAEKAAGGVEAAAAKLSSQMRGLAAAAASAAGAMAAGRLFKGAIREAEQLQRNLFRTQAIIDATGGAAGRAAAQLHEQARGLARVTLESTEGIMRAQQTMLTFRKVQGDVFDDAIAAAVDLASSMRVDLNSAVLQLGKALEDPITGMTALTKSGTVFNEAQRDLVRGMVEAGNVMGAQRFILDELAGQYANVAEKEAAGLAGAQDSLAQSTQEFLIRLSDSFGLLDKATGLYNAASRAVDLMATQIDRAKAYIEAAAVVLTVAYAPAILAATVATGRFVAGLLLTRTALIRTGIGLVVVAAGELAYWFNKLVVATGGWGGALSALGRLAKGVWEGIKTSAASIGPALNAIWATVASGFYSMLEGITLKWWQFLTTLGAGVSEIPGFGGAADAINSAAANAFATMSEYNAKAETAASTAAALRTEAAKLASEGWDKVTEALKDLVGQMRPAVEGLANGESASDKLTEALDGVEGALDGGVGGGGVTGAAGAATDAVGDLTTALEDNADTIVNDVSRAWADFIVDGFRDFDGFVDGVLTSFKRMISDMIATAAQNRLTIGVGVSATGAGTAAAAGTPGTGLLGGILGGGGLIGGIGSGIGLGASSLFGGGIGSYIGTVGAQFSAAMTGSLSAIGGLIGALAPVALGIGLLVKGLSRTYAGSAIRGSFDSQGFAGSEFDFYKGGFLRGNSANYSNVDAATQAFLDGSVSAIHDSVAAMAESLGMGADALETFASEEFTLWIDGMTDEQITAALQEQLNAVAEGMAALVFEAGEFTRAGETELDTLTRLSTSLVAVNSMMDTLGQQMFEVSAAGGEMASVLVDAFGGLDAMAAAVDAYWLGFYSEAERQETAIRQLEDAFADLGIPMSQSRDEFRALVESIDTTTESGAELYAELVSMSAAMDAILPSVSAFTLAMTGTLQQVDTDIQAQIDAANQGAQASLDAARLWYRTSQTLQDFLNDLLGVSSLSPNNAAQQLAFNKQAYDAAVAGALAGDANAAASVPGLADAYLQSVEATASTASEFNIAAGQVAAQVDLLGGVASLQGANEDVLQSLYQEQIDVLESLNAFLQLEGLTNDQIAQLDESVQGLTEDWDGTIATFEDSLNSLEAAINEAEVFSYDYLEERLQVTVDLLPTADIPEYLADLIENAQTGIESSIEFIVTSDLTPDQMWLATNAESEMLKTIEFAVTGELDPEIAAIALATDSELQRNISLILTDDIDEETRLIALASTSELTRMVNVTLDEVASDPDAVMLALSDIGTYAVAVNATMDLDPDIQKIVLEDGGVFVASIEAAWSLDGDQRRVLLEQQGDYAVNVFGLLQNPDDPFAELLLESNTNALMAVTIATAYADDLTDAEIALLNDWGSEVLRTINMSVNPLEMDSLDLLMLDQLAAGDGTIEQGIVGTFWGKEISAWDSSFLDLLFEGYDTVTRPIIGKFWGSAISAWDQDFLDLLTEGYAEVDKAIVGLVEIGDLTDEEQAMLDAITGATTGSITLGGTFRMEPSDLFTAWYEDTTQALMTAPMTDLTTSLDDLRAQVQADIESREVAAEIAALQMQGQAIQDAKIPLVEDAVNLVNEITALEASTGVDIRNNQNDATLNIRPDGTIDYQATHVEYGAGADLATFSDAFWADGGLEDQILAANQAIWAEQAKTQELRAQIVDLGGVPAFAAGGYHGGGLRIVGENGPELENTGPSRIYSNAQTRALLGQDELVRIMRETKEELMRIRDENRQLGMQVAGNTRKSSRLLEQFDKVGMPPVRT